MHVTREFLLSFLVSFLFFFFIFFINQILLLVQQIMLRSVDIGTLLVLVACAIPQFLQYVVPFATLSASSMVLGDLGANNELMAIRGTGIALGRVYRVLIVLSFFLSLLTFYISDYLMPLSSRTYQRRLTEVMRELPTFEIEENATNSVGDVIMRNGEVEGSEIYDIVMFTQGDEPYITLSSRMGKLELVDSENFVYRLDLDDVQLLLTRNDISTYLSALGEEAVMYLDFSAQVPSLTSSNPGNLSSRELWPLIQSRKEMRDRDVASFHQRRENNLLNLAGAIRDSHNTDQLLANTSAIERAVENLDVIGEDEPIQLYYQYYSAEFNKKFALSLGCMALTIVTLPLSLVKIRHGRLVGFGLSLMIAVAYWYILFFSQLKIFSYSFNAGILMYVPDFVMVVAGFVLLLSMRRSN